MTGVGNPSERKYGAKKHMESILLNFRRHNSVRGWWQHWEYLPAGSRDIMSATSAGGARNV